MIAMRVREDFKYEIGEEVYCSPYGTPTTEGVIVARAVRRFLFWRYAQYVVKGIYSGQWTVGEGELLKTK
jgi:hypothetical protein